ncbi:hypothetical protein [Bartonella sp. LJL80]
MDQFYLLSGAMKLPRDMDGESVAKGYMIALEGCSSWSIRESVIRIIKGNADGFNKTFMPAAPELAAYCRELERLERSKIEAIKRRIKADEEQSPAESITAERFQELQGAINQYTGEAA